MTVLLKHQIPAWPRPEAMIGVDGTAELRIHGHTRRIVADDPNDAHDRIVERVLSDIVLEFAPPRPVRPVRLSTPEPDGTVRELAVHPDGGITTLSERRPRESRPWRRALRSPLQRVAALELRHLAMLIAIAALVLTISALRETTPSKRDALDQSTTVSVGVPEPRRAVNTPRTRRSTPRPASASRKRRQRRVQSRPRRSPRRPQLTRNTTTSMPSRAEPPVRVPPVTPPVPTTKRAPASTPPARPRPVAKPKTRPSFDPACEFSPC